MSSGPFTPKTITPPDYTAKQMQHYRELEIENARLRAQLAELREVAEATLSIFANYYGLHADDSQALSSLRAAVEKAREGGGK